MLPAQGFWWETVLLVDVIWPQSNQWERAQFGQIDVYRWESKGGGGGLISGSFQVVDMFDVAHVLNNQANQFCTLY